MASLTLGALAQCISADLVAADGEDVANTIGRRVEGVSSIERAGPAEVSFVANPKYSALARTTRAAALIVETDFPALNLPTLRTSNPYLAWSKAIQAFHPSPLYIAGVHPTAIVAQTARVGARAHIGAYVVIGDHCEIGDDAIILPHVVIYAGVRAGDRLFAHAHAVIREGCRLGDDVVLQNGAIVGSDGFGFAKGPDQRWVKIIQAGPTILDSSVEIQANACIDRASVGETRIGAGTKIDNLVQVGHGSTVGENSLLCSQVGLAGSTTVGNNVILAGQVGAAGHLTIGDGAVVTAQSGIPSDVPAGATVSGYPATENRSWLRSVAAVNRLPDLITRLKVVERKLDALSTGLDCVNERLGKSEDQNL